MNVAMLFNRYVRENYVSEESLVRLRRVADVRWVECDHPTSFSALPDPTPETESWLCSQLQAVDAVVVCHGAPRLSAGVLQSTAVGFVGELEGDRFSPRVDLTAASDNDVIAVDTNHGSSYAVAEWALALVLVSLRNAAIHFRRFAMGESVELSMMDRERDRGYFDGELRGKTVGLVGLGHIARELIALMRPFDVTFIAHDPFVDVSLADALDVDLAPLDVVVTASDVVVVLVPETPATHHLLSASLLAEMRRGSVLVNVSRGTVVSTEGLLRRLQSDDVWVGLDVWDPDPCPPDSPLRHHSNVFYSPHIAGVTRAARRRSFDLMVDELQRFATGYGPRWQLDWRTQFGRAAETLR